MMDSPATTRVRGLLDRRPAWLAPIVVWLLSSGFLSLVLLWLRAAHPDGLSDGFKIRDESSDTAWQTIRLWEMWTIGPTTLWWKHIYPPLYDAIRYVLMQPEVSAGLAPSAVAVDSRLYVVHVVLFGLVAMVVYLWVRDLTRSGWWALAGAMLWSVLPSSVAFMMLLGPTGLALATMAVAFYLLYRFCRTRRNAYAVGFLAALFVASLSRNVVQIHVFLAVAIAAVSFYWMARPRRLWALAANLLLVVMIGFWPARAYILYSTFDVSTHTGYNRAGALWINPLEVPMPTEYPSNIEENAVRLSSGWNTQEMIKANYVLGEAANDLLVHDPVEAITRVAKSLTITLPTMFRSVYVQWYSAYAFDFPLSRALDWLFSGWRFVALILGSIIVIVREVGLAGTWRRVRRYGWFAVFWILTAIPVVLSNRYWPPEVPEPVHSEADRLRGLLDVPVYVLIVLAASILVRKARGRIRRTRTERTATRQETVSAPS